MRAWVDKDTDSSGHTGALQAPGNASTQPFGQPQRCPLPRSIRNAIEAWGAGKRGVDIGDPEDFQANCFTKVQM